MKDGWAVVLVIFAGMAWRAYAWTIQPGVTLDDEIGHFIIARDAWKFPQFIFSHWGRTACTLFFMPLAPLGLVWARFLAFAAASLTSLLTARIALGLGMRRAWLAVLMLECQPWFFNHSHEVITQIPVLLFLALAIHLALKGYDEWASICFGILPLARHEYAVISALWFCHEMIRNKKFAAGITCVPIATTCIAAWMLYGVFTLAPFLNLEAGVGDRWYGRGTWTHFLVMVVDRNHAGYMVILLACVGVAEIAKTLSRISVMALVGSVFVVNTVIYRWGLFQSGGYGIFLMPIAPFIAIAAGMGVEWLWNRGKEGVGWDSIYRFAGSLGLWLSVFVAWISLKPRPLDPVAEEMRQIGIFMEQCGLRDKRVICRNPWAHYVLPMDTPHANRIWFKGLWWAIPLSETRQGDLFLWDEKYAEMLDESYDELIQSEEEWQLLRVVLEGKTPKVALFLRVGGPMRFQHPSLCEP